jgi:hypothetical protein
MTCAPWSVATNCVGSKTYEQWVYGVAAAPGRHEAHGYCGGVDGGLANSVRKVVGSGASTPPRCGSCA